MYQKIRIRDLDWDRETNTLSQDLSSLRGLVDLSSCLRSYEPLEIIGDRETRRYVLSETLWEPAMFELGDIVGWKFRHVDRLGHYLPGPHLTIFND